MTKDEIIKMAREVGMYYREIEDEFHTSYSDGVCFEELERFFHMAQAAAIERNKEIYKQLDETEKSLDEAVRVAVEMEREEFAKQAVDIARRAVIEEREACAKVADEWVQAYEHPSKIIAKMIRQRGQV